MERLKRSVLNYITQTDWILIILALCCTAYGVVLVSSATLSFNSIRLVVVQIGAACVGLVVMIIISKLDYEQLSELSKILFVLCILAMIVTLIFGTGPKGTTNRNWLDLGFISIQPSEFVKIAYIVTFARQLYVAGPRVSSIKNILLILLHAGVIIGLVVLTGDLGMAFVFVVMTLIMMFVAGVKFRWFLLGGALCVAAAPFIWSQLNGFHRQRILVALNPELDPQGYGYQVVQSKIAIGSGQMWGKGLFQGTQIQNELLPAKQTDFIFGVAGEELGFVGAMLVLVLLTALIARVIVVSKICHNDLGTLICAGVYSMFLCQFLGNIGMCIGLFPVIGITLPFFSSGGSSILSVFCALGLVLSVYMRRRAQAY